MRIGEYPPWLFTPETASTDRYDVEQELDREPVTTTEQELNDMVECDGYCGQTYHLARTVDVVAGEQIGRKGRPHPHVKMTSVDHTHPDVEHWCADCANDTFDLTKTAGERSTTDRARSYLTASNVLSFTLGFVTMLIMASVMVW